MDSETSASVRARSQRTSPSARCRQASSRPKPEGALSPQNGSNSSSIEPTLRKSVSQRRVARRSRRHTPSRGKALVAGASELEKA